MTQSELQSKTIDFLRFPLATIIVLVHATGAINLNPDALANIESMSGIVVYNTLSSILSKIIGPAAVPLFFVISGYLYFANVKQWNKETYFTKSKSRIKTLLIPFLLWNAIGFLVGIVKGFVLYYTRGETTDVLLQLGTFLGWIKPFWAQWSFDLMYDSFGNNFSIFYPYVGALWFLRDLIGACILAPVIYLIVKHAKLWGLALLAVAYYTNVWLHIPGFGIEVCFYFSIGAYCGVHKKNLITLASKVCIPMAIICITSFFITLLGTPSFLGFTISGRLSILAFLFSMCVCFINLASWLLQKCKITENKKLTETTFFIFASHGLAISALSFIFSNIFASTSILSKTSLFFLFPISITVICILAFYAMKRFTPKILSILIGQR